MPKIFISYCHADVVRARIQSAGFASWIDMENAVTSLAKMNLPEATEALVQAFNHPLPAVRINAAWCLAKRGDVRAVPGLIEGNRERGWHYEFARVVAPIGSAALPGLLVLAADADYGMRRELIYALKAIGDKAAVPELIHGHFIKPAIPGFHPSSTRPRIPLRRRLSPG